jgi:hypothetical protein
MSITDKLALIATRRTEFNAALHADADALLARYAEVEAKKSAAFTKHHAQLETEETELATVEAAIDRMSNMGNAPGSEPSSEKPKNGG